MIEEAMDAPTERSPKMGKVYIGTKVFSMETLVNLELAKRLKELEYRKPCEFYYQDSELPFSPFGLKRTKNGELLNHNEFDNFIYSAPTLNDASNFICKNIKYKSSVKYLFGKNLNILVL